MQKPQSVLFSQHQTSFLGHVISSQGVQVEQDKIKAMQTWPIPWNIKESKMLLFPSFYTYDCWGIDIKNG